MAYKLKAINVVKIKRLFFLLLIFISLHSYGQTGFASWNEKYKSQSYKQLIDEEKRYAAKVKMEEKEPCDYYRFDTYQMRGKYVGRSKIIDSKVMQSMKIVCWAFPNELP